MPILLEADSLNTRQLHRPSAGLCQIYHTHEEIDNGHEQRDCYIHYQHYKQVDSYFQYGYKSARPYNSHNSRSEGPESNLKQIPQHYRRLT